MKLSSTILLFAVVIVLGLLGALLSSDAQPRKTIRTSDIQFISLTQSDTDKAEVWLKMKTDVGHIYVRKSYVIGMIFTDGEDTLRNSLLLPGKNIEFDTSEKVFFERVEEAKELLRKSLND